VKYQLLAVGDEAGTLHIHEVPLNLIKKIPNEEQLMFKFLERQLQQLELEKSLGEEGGGEGEHSSSHSAHSHHRPRHHELIGQQDHLLAANNATTNATGSSGVRPGTSNLDAGDMLMPPTAPISRPTTTVDPTNNNANNALLGENGLPLTPAEIAQRAEMLALQKEEDDFLKLESIYITEMGLLDNETAGAETATAITTGK
jgi:hypothetical protein